MTTAAWRTVHGDGAPRRGRRARTQGGVLVVVRVKAAVGVVRMGCLVVAVLVVAVRKPRLHDSHIQLWLWCAIPSGIKNTNQEHSRNKEARIQLRALRVAWWLVAFGV